MADPISGMLKRGKIYVQADEPIEKKINLGQESAESVESRASRVVTQIMEPSIQWPESGSK